MGADMPLPKRILAHIQEPSNLAPIIVGLIPGNLIIIAVYAFMGSPHLRSLNVVEFDTSPSSIQK
jgi:hypothetical protein